MVRVERGRGRSPLLVVVGYRARVEAGKRRTRVREQTGAWVDSEVVVVWS